MPIDYQSDVTGVVVWCENLVSHLKRPRSINSSSAVLDTEAEIEADEEER